MNALSKSLPPPPAQLASLSPAPATLADALAQVASWEDCTEGQRRDMASALNTAGRMLGMPLAAIPCDVAWLNQRLFRRAPASFGIGQQRFRNVMSALRAVLRRLGHHAALARGETGLPAEWLALLAATAHQAHRAGLRGFARHCAGLGLAPGAVTDAVLARYLEQDMQQRLGARVTGQGATIARAWNRAIAGAPALTARPLQAPARREQYTLPFEAYPESFQADVRRFEQRMRRDSGSAVFSRGEGGRRLRPATVRARLFSVRQAAAALIHSGLPRDSLTSLRDLVEPVERAGTILDFFHQRAEARLPAGGVAKDITGGQLGAIATTLLLIGKHHAGQTGEALRQLQAWRRLTQPARQSGLGSKARDRLRQLIREPTRSLLLTLPETIMAAARKASPPGIDQARQVRLAVALEILLLCPLRMGNLARLRLDRHLRRLGPGQRRITHLVIEEEETKNSSPMEWPVAAETAALLEAWIRTWRPLRCGGDPASPYLFPGREAGQPASQNGLGNALSALLERELGVEVHPHLMRHFAAWRHLNRHPGEYEIVRRALGHRSVETTVNAYCGLETEAAARHFDTSLRHDRLEARRVVSALGVRRQRRGRG